MPSATDPDPTPDQQQYASTPLRPPVSPITPVPHFAQLASQPAATSTEATQDEFQSTSEVAIITTTPGIPPSIAAPQTHPPPSPPQPLLTTNLPPTALLHEADPHATTHTITQPPLPPGPPNFIPPPSPLDLPLDENTDYISVRAALNILQMQRDKARRDLRTLSSLQTSLAGDPQGFYEQVRAQGALRYRHPAGDALAPSWEDMDLDDSLSSSSSSSASDDDGDGDGEDTTQAAETVGGQKLPLIPSKQNIVRCPPVNWAKYHIAGETLDRMHEDQRRRPTTFEPERDESRGAVMAEGWREGYKVVGPLGERERGGGG